jgi:hypothetical protein
MMLMPKVKCSYVADRTDGLIPAQPAELRRSPDKLFVPSIAKLLFNKSFHHQTRPTEANQ